MSAEVSLEGLKNDANFHSSRYASDGSCTVSIDGLLDNGKVFKKLEFVI